jgi:hypothetical protein
VRLALTTVLSLEETRPVQGSSFKPPVPNKDSGTKDWLGQRNNTTTTKKKWLGRQSRNPGKRSDRICSPHSGFSLLVGIRDPIAESLLAKRGKS